MWEGMQCVFAFTKKFVSLDETFSEPFSGYFLLHVGFYSCKYFLSLYNYVPQTLPETGSTCMVKTLVIFTNIKISPDNFRIDRNGILA